MHNNDLHNNIKASVAILPTTLGATGLISSSIIDRQGYGGVEFVIEYGSITTTGTDVAVIVKEGDVTGTMTSVADADLLGTEVLAAIPASATARTAGVNKEVAKRVGYKGQKRYTQLVLNGTGTTSAGIVAAVAILHCPNVAPVSNP